MGFKGEINVKVAFFINVDDNETRMTYRAYFILFSLFCFACNEKQSIPTRESENMHTSNDWQIEPSTILDTLIKYEKLANYQTDFIEEGWKLISCLYQGKVNGIHFGIKTNCNDGTIMVYHKKYGSWIVTDSLNDGIGWNFKTFKLLDVNKDKHFDVVLLDFDNWRRVVFIFNPKKLIIEHNGTYDRLKQRD